MSPPKIKVSRRTPGSIPQGYVLGRVSPGRGDVQLLKMDDLKTLGVQARNTPGPLAKIPAETVLANPGPGDAAPVALTISDVLDFISQNQGDILFRNATDWVTLEPGTTGQVLTTHGPAADPSWENGGSGSGGGVVYDDGTVPAGNTVINTTSEVAFASAYTFDPAIAPLILNDVVRVTLRGTYNTDAVTPPDLTLKFYFGATVLGSTGAITLATSQVNRGWEAHLLLFMTAGGALGTSEVQGSAQLNGWQGIVNTAPVNVNATVTQNLRAKAQWSVADADNSITLRQMLVEHMPGANVIPTVLNRQFIMPGDVEGIFMNVTSDTKSFIVPTVFVNEK